jgi:aspartyl-tRNA(Asn)/glutamyl-tRNA(Gln) amidotransferase subunit A
MLPHSYILVSSSPLPSQLLEALKLEERLEDLLVELEAPCLDIIVRAAQRMSTWCSERRINELAEEALKKRIAVQVFWERLSGCSVPVTFKDNMLYRGSWAQAGTGYFAVYSEYTAEVVERLEQKGFTPVARTNMHELGLGTTNVNLHTGTPENPAAPGRITGGSTGGGAASVALGLAPASLGTDAAGSLRVPAAFTGTVGVKPKVGELPRNGVLLASNSTESVGLVTVDVAVAALVLEALKPGFLRSVLEFCSFYRRVPPRIFVPENLVARSDEVVARGFWDTVSQLERAGASIHVADLQPARLVERARALVMLAEAYSAYRELYERFSDKMGEDVKFLLKLGSEVPHWLYSRASAALSTARARADVLAVYDAVLTPTVPVDAPKVEEADWRLSASTRLIEFTGLWNALDVPAISIPVEKHRLPSGLPLSIQLAAPTNTARLLGLALALGEGLG